MGGYANSVALQSDGKIITAGEYVNGGCVLVRYNTNGTLDNSFGTAGIDSTMSLSFFRSIIIQTDGKIIAAGKGGNGFAVARYNTNGILDNTFGTGGKVTTTMAGNDYVNAIALQTDGKIVAVGGANGYFGIARYTSDGALDTTFGTGGKIILYIGGYSGEAKSLAIQADGKIIVAGNANSKIVVTRYDVNGVVDNTFGTAGVVFTNVTSYTDEGNAVVIQPDGKIVVAGDSYNGSKRSFTIVRYTANGILDNAFGTNGIDTTYYGDAAFANAIMLQPDGKIVIAGKSNYSGWGFTLVRYTTNGSLDNTFGTGGIVFTYSGATSGANGVVMQSDGKIVVAGDYQGSFNHQVEVARYYSGVVGIEESGLLNFLKVYPNPAINNITIESVQKSTIEIFNIQGELIFSFFAEENHEIIDVSKLSKGMYFVKVKNENGVTVKKFVKE